MAAEAVAAKANRVPERVAMMDAPGRLAWLKGDEAESLLTHKRRRELKRRWLAESQGAYRGPSHELVADPAAEAARVKIIDELAIQQRREQAPRGTVDGDAPCGCAYCRHQSAHWPGPYVDGQPRAFECHLEHNPPPEDENGPGEWNRSHGARTPKGDALRGGLRERDPGQRSIWARTAEAMCEGGCGRSRPKGMRYCVECRKEVIAVLTKAGWEPERIGEFLDPKDKI